MRYLHIFASLLFTSLAYASDVKGNLVERVVAVVNDKTILYSEVQEATKRLPPELQSQNAADPEGPKKVLDQLINQILIQQEIEKRGLSANDGVVDGAVAQVMKQNGMSSLDQLTRELKKEGLTLDDYRASLKKQIESSRLINDAIRSKIQISDQDVLAEHRRMTASDTEQTMMKVRMIFKKKTSGDADKKSMSRLVREINAGIPFERIADRETDGPGKGEGGSIGLINPAEMQPELASVLKTMKPGEISKPIFASQGSYLLKCVEISKVKSSTTLTDKEKEELREKLINLETERAFDSFVRDLRNKAQIQIL